MKISKDSDVYMSFAQTPGNLGAKLYNFFFDVYGINAVYIPRKALEPEVVTDVIKKLELKGASVSMPLKQSIIPLLDDLSAEAKEIGSVNTVINNKGFLTGHNTDAWGFYKTIENLTFKTATIYGAGGVVPSILWALKKKGISFEKISIEARDKTKAVNLANKYDLNSDSSESEVLINATPSGEGHDDQVVKLLATHHSLIDLNTHETPRALREIAASRGIKLLSGKTMYKHQFKKQFEIFHGISIDLEAIESVLE